MIVPTTLRVLGKASIIAQNLVSWWKMGDWASDSLPDSKGSNTGTTYNMDSSNVVTGQVGDALKFNGTNEYVSFGNDGSLSTNSMSWCLWVKSASATNPSDNQGIVFKAVTTDYDREISIFFKSGTGYIGIQIGNAGATGWAVDYQTTTDYYDATWHHVVVTKDYAVGGDTFKIYIDGTLLTTITASSNGRQNTDNLTLGRVSDGSTAARYFIGTIDDVRVYDVAISQAVVTELAGQS